MAGIRDWAWLGRRLREPRAGRSPRHPDHASSTPQTRGASPPVCSWGPPVGKAGCPLRPRPPSTPWALGGDGKGPQPASGSSGSHVPGLPWGARQCPGPLHPAQHAARTAGPGRPHPAASTCPWHQPVTAEPAGSLHWLPTMLCLSTVSSRPPVQPTQLPARPQGPPWPCAPRPVPAPTCGGSRRPRESSTAQDLPPAWDKVLRPEAPLPCTRSPRPQQAMTLRVPGGRQTGPER